MSNHGKILRRTFGNLLHAFEGLLIEISRKEELKDA
jgi:hypothetical protein